MFSVLSLFLIPIGGGIPAGVLLAQSKGLPWPLTAGLYLISDVILALAFEPVLRLLVSLAARVPFLARFGQAMKLAMAQNVRRFGGPGTGPVMLVLISFGADPMTGRACALAAGHRAVMGWVFAITGDMLYYAVVALTTLKLNTLIHNPERTVFLVLSAMFLLPMLLQRLRQRWRVQTDHPSFM